MAAAASAARCCSTGEGLTRSSKHLSEPMRHRSATAAPSPAPSAVSTATSKTEEQPGATAAGQPEPLKQPSQLLLQVSIQQLQVPKAVSTTESQNSQSAQPQHVTATAAGTAAGSAAEQPLSLPPAADKTGHKAASAQQQRKPGQQAVLHPSGAMRHCDLEQLLLDKADTDYTATAAGSTAAVMVAAGSSSAELPSPTLPAAAAPALNHSTSGTSSSTATTQQPAALHPSGAVFAAALDQLLLDKADADHAAAMATDGTAAAVAGFFNSSSSTGGSQLAASRSPMQLPRVAGSVNLVGNTTGSSSMSAPRQQAVLHPPPWCHLDLRLGAAAVW